MLPITVIILTRNEEANLVDCIRSARLVSDDVLVVDCGSTDATLNIASSEGARIHTINWKSFGCARNAGAQQAKHDWIFTLDADERISTELAKALKHLSFDNTRVVYRMHRHNYFGDHLLRFGTAGFDRPARLYNRTAVRWDASPVHEELVGEEKVIRFIPEGHVIHYAMRNAKAYEDKLKQYAFLCSLKYYQQGKKATLIKRFAAPLFDAAKSYIFQLGFLEGKKGFTIARLIAWYTWKKYSLLHRMYQSKPVQANDVLIPKRVKASA
jgi:glycosyltransferase involved in cell wall biosynthesis